MVTVPPPEYPCRVPLKVIGREPELEPGRIAELIQRHLGAGPEGTPTANRRGAYISYTFWVTLPDEHAERPLRVAIQALPGVILQL